MFKSRILKKTYYLLKVPNLFKDKGMPKPTLSRKARDNSHIPIFSYTMVGQSGIQALVLFSSHDFQSLSPLEANHQ